MIKDTKFFSCFKAWWKLPKSNGAIVQITFARNGDVIVNGGYINLYKVAHNNIIKL